ncbi:DUF6701 domain-containing protein [Stutzerimonas nitrititolerans]|uniref:DUF6701 domain-containing protein n=1 Tax=Stutzerimonas nitrititolerans TaxID=2482751 RepID=UPI0028B08C21|nr:DUF6701 domain-containing protein [Stutzerimonas nitrititolerans]
MKYYAKSLVWIGLVVLLKCQVANAAVHNISQGQLPICNNWNNSWSMSGSTYTCSASVSFVAGDEYVANSPITLRADAGITLSGNKVGTVTSPITLQTTYGTLNATVGGSVIYGSLNTGSGALTLTGVSLTGNIQTSAKLTITQSAINGNVSGTGEGIISGSSVSGAVSFGNGFTGSDTTFASSVSSTVISLKSGSVSGSITGTNITLNGTNVDGKVTGTGTGSFTNLTIGNNVSMTNGLIATNTLFSSTLTSTNGAVTLFGGLVAGLVNVSCCKVTVSQGATISNGIVAGNNGIDIRDSTVTGDLKAGNNPIVMVNVNMTSGAISPGNNSLTITGGTVTADVTNAHRVFISDNAVVTGDVLARYEVSVSDSKVVGDIATVVGHDGLHHVYLNNSEVYGNVTVRDDWGTINGDESSRIYGVCTYKIVDPISLCEAGGGPGPIELVECKVELQVGHMVAGVQQEAKIVIKDQAECKKPAKLDFIFDYKRPEDPPADLNIFLNGRELKSKEKETVILDFAGSNVAPLNIQYDEVGELSLRIDAEGQREKLFVSRPAHLTLSADEPSCNPQNAFDEGNCPKFKEAGELFDLEVSAFNAKNDEVENFEHVLMLKVMSEGGDRFYPREGKEPKVTKKVSEQFERHLRNKDITPQVAINDVGIVKIEAVVEDYLGSGHKVSGKSEFIGRFVPAWLEVTANAPMLQPNCVTDSQSQTGFSYQGQAINFAVAPMLTITGKNRDNETTFNYEHGDFWRWQSSGFTHDPEFGSEDANIHDNVRLSGNPNFTVDTNDLPLDDGARDVTIRGQALTYVRNLYAPLASDAAFRPYLALRFPLTDQDEVCYRPDGGSDCEEYVLDNISFPEANSQIRLGRAVLENANGSELAPLNMPLVIESWQGDYFARTSDDSCTIFPEEPVPDLSDYTDNLSAGETTASMEGVGANRFVELTAPGLGNEGSVRVTPAVPELLRYDWDGSGSFQNPNGLATFGIYKGTKPLIFRREIYRGM